MGATGGRDPPCPLNFPHPRARAVVLWTETATTTVRGYARDTGTAFEVHFAAAKPQSGKGAGLPHEIFHLTGRQHRNQGSCPSRAKAQSWAKNETDEGSTVRCPSKEPAHPHNPNTTHTPITYAGHNTSKHARNPDKNRGTRTHRVAPWPHRLT